MAANPDFVDEDGRPVDPTSRAEVALKKPSSSTGDEARVEAFSKNGRIDGVSVALWQVSPAAGAEVEKNVISYLGPPDRTAQNTRDRYIIWIDGNLRARLTVGIIGETCSIAARSVSLEIETWSPKLSRPTKEAEQEWYLQSWGEKSKGNLLSSLPDQLNGIRLGMEPWQVRAVAPELRFWKRDENQDFARSNDAKITVGFWKGKAWTIYVEASNPAPDAKQLRDNLLAKFGYSTIEIVGPMDEWNDGHIRMETMATDKAPEGTSLPSPNLQLNPGHPPSALI
ncbi:MAG: hypothetical protein M3Y72_15565 [Acidobacteriota bacterium]|nr:hypothetical protein [Acidobacteriota bacterium]